jgi:hypothetical protein
MEKEQPITFTDSQNTLTVKSESKIRIISHMKLIGSRTELPIEIVADFTNIPESYHQIYLEMFKYEYDEDKVIHNNVNVSNTDSPNPKSKNRLTDFLVKKLGFNL